MWVCHLHLLCSKRKDKDVWNASQCTKIVDAFVLSLFLRVWSAKTRRSPIWASYGWQCHYRYMRCYTRSGIFIVYLWMKPYLSGTTLFILSVTVCFSWGVLPLVSQVDHVRLNWSERKITKRGRKLFRFTLWCDNQTNLHMKEKEEEKKNIKHYIGLWIHGLLSCTFDQINKKKMQIR